MEDLQIIELFFQRSEEAVSQKIWPFFAECCRADSFYPGGFRGSRKRHLSGGLEQDPAGGAKSAQILLYPALPGIWP